MNLVPVAGWTDDGWGAVRDAFASALTGPAGGGGQLCIHHRGRVVVDLYGGWADAASTVPYPVDALQVVLSAGKGVCALAVGVLFERGLVSPDDRVASVWPEFAAAGKADITIADVLANRSGVITIEPTVEFSTTLDDERITALLAGQPPAWAPGTRFGYHPQTFGWLVAEIVRRVDGRRLDQFVDDEFAAPLAGDLHFGIPDELLGRLVRLIEPDPPVGDDLEALFALLAPASLSYRAMTLSGVYAQQPDGLPFHRHPGFLRSLQPSSNLVADARSLSRLYASVLGEVDGVRTLNTDTLTQLTTECSAGIDATLGGPSRFGLGLMLSNADQPWLGDGSFGSPGASGSTGWADPATGIAVGLAVTRWGSILPRRDPRERLITEAIQSAVDG